MRVVFLLRQTVPSAETLTILAVTMGAEMARAGARVLLLVRRLDTPGRRELLARYGMEDVEGLEVEEFRSRWIPRFDRWRGTIFRAALRRKLASLAGDEPVVVYTTGRSTLELAAELVRDRQRTGIPVVYESQKVYRDFYLDGGGARAEEKAAKAGALERVVHGGADGLVAIGEPLLADILEAGDVRGRTLVAPLGTHENPEADRVARDVDCLYAGDLAPWKGAGILLDAFERTPVGRLRFVGGVKRSRVEAFREDVRRRGLTERVEVLGWRPPAEIPGLLARTKVVPIPLPDTNAQAARHTSPHKLFEALEAGCAVVASDLPSIRSIVRDGRDATLVPPGDPDALAEALERLLRDDGLRSEIAARGRETARRYRWPERARAVLGLIREVG